MRLSDRKDLLKVKRTVIFSLIPLIIVFFLLLYVIYSSRSPQYYEKEFFAMGTKIRIYISSTKMNPKNLAELIVREFRRIDEKYASYNPQSVIYKINHSDSWVKVDKETLALIEAAVGYARKTNGAFDPVIGRLVHLWGFSNFSTKDASSLHPPPESEIKNLLKTCNYKNIEIDSKNYRVRLLNGAWLDLGGLVKGYALEKSYKLVKAIDPEATGFVDAGGDIRIIGPKFGNSYWTIGIKNPNGPGFVDIVYLKEGSIATSGDYERFFVYEGKKYHHIIDPKTGYPAEGVKSVTVITDDAVSADVLSTAGFVMAKDWLYVITKFPEYGAQVFVVLNDGTTVKSEGFSLYERKP